MFQKDTTCTRLECYRHLYKLCQHNPAPIPFFWASRPSLPAARLAQLLAKAVDVESNPGPTTYINKHTPVIWICDLCHKQIKKQQTSIRCNHTHNTHLVHLNCTQIKQRQYQPDWRCTIYTPTHIVTTTPSTDKTTTHRRQITTQPLTDNNQPKDKNIVILQININGIRNKIEELKKLVHNTQPYIITIQETKRIQKAKTPKIPHYTTIRTDREHKQGGGLITLIKDDITFKNINMPKTITHTTQNYN